MKYIRVGAIRYSTLSTRRTRDVCTEHELSCLEVEQANFRPKYIRCHYCIQLQYNQLFINRDGNGPGRPRAGPGRAGPESPGPRAETGRNRPKDFSFVLHHCVRECMPVNVPSKCTCVISLFLTDRKGARNI